jgi:hypothetical protein
LDEYFYAKSRRGQGREKINCHCVRLAMVINKILPRNSGLKKKLKEELVDFGSEFYGKIVNKFPEYFYDYRKKLYNRASMISLDYYGLWSVLYKANVGPIDEKHQRPIGRIETKNEEWRASRVTKLEALGECLN